MRKYLLLLLAAAGGSLFVVIKNGKVPGFSGANSGAKNIFCSSDVDELSNIPPLSPDLHWSSPESTTLGDTFSIDGNMMALTGNMWTTTSTSNGEYLNDDPFLQKVLNGYQSYYHDLLDTYHWQIQTDINGHKLIGIEADGANYGSDYGVIKIQNDKIRVIALQMGRSHGVTFFNVFLSDIVPLSQIIPGYKFTCSDGE